MRQYDQSVDNLSASALRLKIRNVEVQGLDEIPPSRAVRVVVLPCLS
ncbi:MAG: hypothetical protein ACK58L_08675 [Planctomycetota bacterium]